MERLIEMPEVALDFIKERGFIVNGGNGNDYVYLPHWYKISEDGKVHELDFDSLPEELITVIEKYRTAF